MLKTPNFWIKKNIISYALLPLSLIYFVGFFLLKIFSKKRKISKSVICVGTLIAGGSGKTPTAIALGKILQEMSVDFAFLSRGYMNDGSKFLMLKKSDQNKASQVGDEPLLLSEIATTFVAKDRFFGATQIEAMKDFQVILLDDGMQNNSLQLDLTILVIDGNLGFGNGFLLPAGPMREPICSGLKKADLVIVIGEMKQDLQKKLVGKKIVGAKIIPLNLGKFYGRKLIAFCGLAYPEKFFSFLRKNDLQILETHEFRDHHPYIDVELETLFCAAQEQGAELITTKKDWVKFSPSFQKKISYLDIDLKFDDEKTITEELRKIL